MKKEFDLGTVLTVSTGRLLTKQVSSEDNGIGDLYLLLEHMTGDAPFTHSLGRFAGECKPYLLEEFPELLEVDLEVLDQLMEVDKDYHGKFRLYCLDDLKLKESYMVSPIPEKAHTEMNPLLELESLIRAGKPGKEESCE